MILRFAIMVLAAVAVCGRSEACMPQGKAVELMSVCDSLAAGTHPDIIVTAADDGCHRVVGRGASEEYAPLFAMMLDADRGVECDCCDDYDPRVFRRRACCAAYRNGRRISWIVVPVIEADATKGSITYPFPEDAAVALTAF